MAKESKPLGIRIATNLKERLSLSAEKHGRSLNAEIALRLRESFESKSQVIDEIFDSMSLGKIQRMRSTSTPADTKRILSVLRNMGTEKIILGARKNQLNNAVLIFVAQTESITFLMDNTSINMARKPRELEVQNIFHELDKLGLLEYTEYCENYLPETSGLESKNALQVILEKGKPHKLIDISDFLYILSVHNIFNTSEFHSQG